MKGVGKAIALAKITSLVSGLFCRIMSMAQQSRWDHQGQHTHKTSGAKRVPKMSHFEKWLLFGKEEWISVQPCQFRVGV